MSGDLIATDVVSEWKGGRSEGLLENSDVLYHERFDHLCRYLFF
jgi:hypothetical protein